MELRYDKKAWLTIVESMVNDLTTAAYTDDLPTAIRLKSVLHFIQESNYCDYGDWEKISELRGIVDTLYDEWKTLLRSGDTVNVLPATSCTKNSDNNWYRAKIVNYDSIKRLAHIHFLKWAPKFDRDICLDSSESLVFPDNSMLVLARAGASQYHSEVGDYPASSFASTQASGGDAESKSDIKSESNSENQLVSKSGRVIRLKSIPKSISNSVVRGSNSSNGDTNLTSDSNNENSSEQTNEAKSAKTKGKKRKSSSGMAGEERDINDWVCSTCWQLESATGSKLILCDGPCLRSFHADCLQETITDTDSKWYCWNCRNQQHNCFVCNKLGADFVDVCKCSQYDCGKYYHAECVSTENCDFIASSIRYTDDNEQDEPQLQPQSKSNKRKAVVAEAPLAAVEDSNSTTTAETGKAQFRFQCPLHVCDTCHAFYGKLKGSKRRTLFGCLHCPRAFHENCVPPGTRFNSLLLICPLHPDVELPSDKPIVTAADLLPLRTDGSSSSSSSSGNPTAIAQVYIPSKREGDKKMSSRFNLLWEQMALPDDCPREDNCLDNHFCLPVQYKNGEFVDQPKHFKMINKLCYDCLPEKEKSTPYHNSQSVDDQATCDCVFDCGSRCFNRLLCVECDDRNCNVLKNRQTATAEQRLQGNWNSNNCGNRDFSFRNYADTEVFREDGMGFGLRSTSHISQGQLVIEYIGEVIDGQMVQERFAHQRQHYPSDKDYYVMQLEQNFFVDGKFMGNNSRFINHSCDPNCELQLWIVKGRMHIGIVALREIEAGESLSYDYQFDTNESNIFKCYCKTVKCRGTMAPKRKQSIENIKDLSLAQRSKLLYEARNKLCKTTEQLIQEEWQLFNCTGKYLPGEKSAEVRNGLPSRNISSAVRDHHLFLPRNARAGANFLKRSTTKVLCSKYY